jgi:small subunit ribosomal protein S20
MPILKSARKRVRVSRKAAIRNSKTKRSLREAIKNFTKSLTEGKPGDVAKAQSAAMSAIDRAAKSNIIHKNKAARQKARLSAAAKKAGIKPAAKPSAKKAPAKKAPAKKPAAKKPAAKTSKK